jgi:hypothetical protein
MVSGPPGSGYDSNQKKKSFEMNFLKELSLNDKVVIHENFSEIRSFSVLPKKTKLLCAAAESQNKFRF